MLRDCKMSVAMSVCLPACLSVCLLVCLSVCLPVCLPVCFGQVCPEAGVVLDSLVKPGRPIIDYNTAYSGITAEAMKSVSCAYCYVNVCLASSLLHPFSLPFPSRTHACTLSLSFLYM